MSLRIVGAGWPRTGTTSLKIALETLLSSRCYHMYDLFSEPAHIEIWEQGLKGDMSGVHRVMTGYGAALDWPASFFWRELLAANPEAVVLLSVRDSLEWWRSMSATIVPISEDGRELSGDTGRYRPMMTTLMRKATGADDWSYRGAVLAAYERNTAHVRDECPPGRLVEWSPGDGWGPICAALGVPEPDRPFPWVNTSTQFNERINVAFGPA
jgi:Sulfotransferase domain